MIKSDDISKITNEFVTKTKINKFNKQKYQISLEYKEYFNKNISLKTYKIPELKIIAKQHNLFVTGTKPLLIERIMNHFNKTKYAVKIQSCFRRWLVNVSMHLSGPALKNRNLCVNDKDFVTMEPLVEIPIENFYSYMDSNNFVYGFDICSLIDFIKKSAKIENPYNREKLKKNVTDDIKKLYKINYIIYTNFSKENEKLKTEIVPSTSYTRINLSVSHTPQQRRLLQLNESRRNSLSQRVTDLFLEIDQLGNYTNANWFNSLNTQGYIRLYRHLYDVWYLRSNLSREIRHNICPLPTPFNADRNRSLEADYIKKSCIEVFENLVFTGIDDEHRRLGTFHALTALTIVSTEARDALPWLYESVAVF